MLQYNVHRRRTWFHSIDMLLSYRYLRLKKSGSKTNSYWISMKFTQQFWLYWFFFWTTNPTIYEHKHIKKQNKHMWIFQEHRKILVKYGGCECILSINQSKWESSYEQQFYLSSKRTEGIYLLYKTTIMIKLIKLQNH